MAKTLISEPTWPPLPPPDPPLQILSVGFIPTSS